MRHLTMMESVIIGWGAVADYPDKRQAEEVTYELLNPDKLQEVNVTVVTKETCKAAMENYTITDGMLCAGGVEGRGPCVGDSGGPLTYKSGEQHVLIGDVSWGEECALAGKYGVYGRISYYRTWIEGKMTSPKYCGNGPDADA